MRWSICISGKGGQGIKKLGECLAEAVLLKEMNVLQTSTFTPEVRGGDSSTHIIIGHEKIYYPFVEKVDVLLALNKNGYILNRNRIYEGTLVIYDSNLIVLPKSPKIIAVPFTDIAKKEIGKAIFSNMIGLGVLVQITDIVSDELVLEVLKKR